jgi:sec-independent protein translocase protein TatC
MSSNPSVTDQPEDDRKMPLLDHLIELRKRLLWSVVALILLFLAFFYFAEPIFKFLAQPLQARTNQPLVYTALTEAFFTYIKLSFFGAFLLGFPFFAAQIWLFVAPGLYRHERSAFLPFLISTPIMFYIGAAGVYYFVVPVAWDFFLGFQTEDMQLLPRVSEYLSLLMQLMFAFGLAFELPVLLTLLVRVGIVSTDGLKSKRRYAIVAAFILAAILTPPDVVSQISLAVPIIILYEVAIIIGRMIEKKRDAQDAIEEEGEEAAPPPPAKSEAEEFPNRPTMPPSQ